MATAIKFWQLPEEETLLLDYMTGTGDILACRFRLAPDPEQFAPGPLLAFIEERDPDDVLIGPREFMEQAKIFTVEREGEMLHGCSYLDSPLVLYSRPRFHGPRELWRSNMCAEWWDSQPGVDGLIRKPEPFIKWAQRIFRWVRRFTPQSHRYKSYRITDRVAEELDQGLKLAP